VQDYLRLRRALGFKLEAGRALAPAAGGHLEAAGAATVTSDLAIAWARAARAYQPKPLGTALAIARGFCPLPAALDPATEVPRLACSPPDGTGRRGRSCGRSATSAVCCRAPEPLRPALRAATYEALFGLLAPAACGWRGGASTATTPTSAPGSSRSATRSFDRTRLVPWTRRSPKTRRAYPAER